MTQYDYIGKNMGKIREMVKNGLLDSKVIIYYNVAKSYKECKDIPSIMQRYTEVSNIHRLQPSTVRKIVAEMRKPFKK